VTFHQGGNKERDCVAVTEAVVTVCWATRGPLGNDTNAPTHSTRGHRSQPLPSKMCCAVSCHAVPCHVVSCLHHAMQCAAVHCTMPRAVKSDVRCFSLLCCAVKSAVLSRAVLCCAVPCRAVPCCAGVVPPEVGECLSEQFVHEGLHVTGTSLNKVLKGLCVGWGWGGGETGNTGQRRQCVCMGWGGGREVNGVSMVVVGGLWA